MIRLVLELVKPAERFITEQFIKDLVALDPSCSLEKLLSEECLDPSLHENLLFVESCARGREDWVHVLLDDSRVDITARNHAAVDLALEHGHDEIAQLLMERMGVPVPHRIALNETGSCLCCEKDSIELYANICEHATCVECSEVCGRCMETICVNTDCSIPLECSQCEEGLISCHACAYSAPKQLKKCDECGGDMTIHKDYMIDYGE